MSSYDSTQLIPNTTDSAGAGSGSTSEGDGTDGG